MNRLWTNVSFHTLVATLFCLASTSAVLAQTEAEHDLRPIWVEGQAATYQITATQVRTITIDLAGNVRSVTQTSGIEGQASWTVTRANPEGGGTVRFRLTNLKASRTVSDGKVSRTVRYSNADGDEGTDNAQKVLKAMTSHDLTVTVSSDGKIEKVEGVAAIARDADDSEGNVMNDAYFTDIVRDLATVAGLEQEQAAGATWTASSVGTHEAGKLDFNEKYEFVGVENVAEIPVAMINRQSTFRFTPELAEGEPAPNLQVNQSERSSQFMIDLSRNEVVGSNIDRVFELSMSRDMGNRQLSQTIRDVSNTQILRLSETMP